MKSTGTWFKTETYGAKMTAISTGTVAAETDTEDKLHELIELLHVKVSRLANLLTPMELRDAIHKRLGAFLRVSGVDLQILVQPPKAETSQRLTERGVNIPLTAAAGDYLLRLEFEMPQISSEAKRSIFLALVAALDDLITIYTHRDWNTTAESGFPENMITVAANDGKILTCSEAAAQCFGIEPGKMLLEDITTEECREYLRNFLSAAGKDDAQSRQMFTMRKGSTGKIDIEMAIIDRDRNEITCSLSEVGAAVNAPPPQYSPAHVAEGLAHRLRSPLTTIMSCCSQLLASTKSIIDSEEEDFLKWIDKAAGLQNRTIDRYLMLYGPVHTALRSCDLNKLLLTVAEEYQTRYGDRLEIQPAGKGRAHLDIDLMLLAISELLDNAFEADNNHKVSFSWENDGGKMIFKIVNACEDDLPEFTRHFCEPFHTTKSEHVGLGLAIAKHYLSLFGGELRAAVLSGKVTITVQLPLEQNPTPNSQQERN